MTYSIDFRKKVLDIKEREKISFEKVSKRFGIEKNTVFVWSKNILPLKNRNRAPTKISIDKLKEDVLQYSDAYQYESAERLGVSKSGIQKALKRLNITYKKSYKTFEGKKRRKIKISE
ncbi:transposase [Orientia tsutsugamushi str. Ikeda]|uniref:Transposase n=1 Tax=Orientia tsutsugamushi (strain Ikeda) TaxID=334380 RepID=B3CR54_ORITI|nr:IS630 transposase-related protein [Orientia tsutsugamushi]BAG39961.1 transposase [Orientia tsutsugamushi str. Ikeda]